MRSLGTIVEAECNRGGYHDFKENSVFQEQEI